MSIFKLGVLFEADRTRLGREVISGARKILFVEGNFSLKPKDDILIIVDGDIPVTAIATTGKIGILPMTANEAKHIEAVVPAQGHIGNGWIEAKIFTEIHIAEIEILPVDIQETVNKRYESGELKSE